MVPIHDTDLAEQRWSKAEWENYELWEKVEVRLRRRKRLWIACTLTVFFVLSAIPIVISKWPKWTTRSLARQLALEINQMKRDASIQRTAMKLNFPTTSSLSFVVHRTPNCTAGEGEVFRTGVLAQGVRGVGYQILPPSKGTELGVPGLVNEICYDPLSGSAQDNQGSSPFAFGIISVNDLTEKRLDRMTVLLLTGPSAEISFD